LAVEPPADWLGDADRVAGLGRRLAGAGVQADRLALYRRTLHPGILSRATAWAPKRPVEIFDREHGLDLSLGFAGSPLDQVIGGGGALTLDAEAFERADGGWSVPLQGFKLKRVLVTPLHRGVALAIGTRRRDGFGEADLTLIGKLVQGLAKRENR
jgi:adenylate cyclase